jgi:hypothetical protein
MSEPKPLKIDEQALFQEWFELRHEVAALETALIGAGRITQEELRQARAETTKAFLEEKAAFEAMMQRIQPGKKGPGPAD